MENDFGQTDTELAEGQRPKRLAAPHHVTTVAAIASGRNSSLSVPPHDIFISYAHQDVDWVRPLAAELERRGWRVFWDRRTPAGKDWRLYIGGVLEHARCVVVVWSKHSISSKFVSEEADEGNKREILVPILRHRVQIPFGFRSIHAADLSEWSPDQLSNDFETFITDLAGVLGPLPSVVTSEPALAPAPKPPPPQPVNAPWQHASVASDQGDAAPRVAHARLSDEPPPELTPMIPSSPETVTVEATNQPPWLQMTPAAPLSRDVTAAEEITPQQLPVEPELDLARVTVAGSPSFIAPEDLATPVPRPAAAFAGIGVAEAAAPTPPIPPKPAIGLNDAGPERASASAASDDMFAAPVTEAPILVARHTPNLASKQRDISAALPPPHPPTPVPPRTLPSTSATGRARLVVLALIGLGAVGAGIYTFTGIDPEPDPPIAAPEPLIAAPSAPESPPAPPPTLAPSKHSPQEAEAALGLSRSDWQAAQLGLKSQGFDFGAANGVVGLRTRQAVAAWQARVGAEGTGYLAAGQLEQIMGSSQTAGQVFTDTLEDGSPCPFCPEMVVIPGGSFTIGSTPEEQKWAVGQGGKEAEYEDEQPVRDVNIDVAFALGRTEVTREQFERFEADTERDMSGGCYNWSGLKWKLDRRLSWRGPGFNQDHKHPVVCISWDDATAYVNWLAKQTGKQYMLPTEALWEYAARARTTTMRFWGDDRANQDTCAFANVADLTSESRNNKLSSFYCRDMAIFTREVGRYNENSFGLFDILGNVWEWNQDCYHESYDGRPSDGSEWKDGLCTPQRVLRGGSWGSLPAELRSANRIWVAPDHRYDDVGFRVMRVLDP